MKIRQNAVGDVMVIHLSGEIWGRKGEPEAFTSTIDKLVADGTLSVVVNLSELRLISSIGIGMLVSAYKTLTKSGGRIVLADAGDPIKPIFRVLESPLELFPSEEKAVAFLQKPV